jgi:hypothetical protein
VKIRTRNRLLLLAILMFPFIVLFGFIFSEYISPPAKNLAQPDTNSASTNIYSPR